jgi:hypothetical protein
MSATNGNYLESVNACRESDISQLFTLLTTTLTTYQEAKVRCSELCDQIQLGAFTKELYRLKLLQPPVSPFDGHSVKSVCGNLKTLKLPNAHQYGYYRSHIESDLTAALDRVEKSVSGIDLQT